MRVENMYGFNFLPNPFQEGTHIFTCLKGEFICVSPEEGERFKYSRVVRPASDEEVKHYNRSMLDMIVSSCFFFNPITSALL